MLRIGRRTGTPSSSRPRRSSVSAIAPLRLVDSTNVCSHDDRTERGQPTERAGASPQRLLQAVVLARVRREDVDDDVQVVEQDPAGLAAALGAARQQALVAVVLQLLVDRVVDRLRLALRVARSRSRRSPCRRRSRAGRSRGCRSPCCPRRSPRSAPPAPRSPGRVRRAHVGERLLRLPCRAVEPVRLDVLDHLVGHQVADRHRPRRTRRRIELDEESGSAACRGSAPAPPPAAGRS